MPERWATFDCYGALIYWNGGVRRTWYPSTPDNERV